MKQTSQMLKHLMERSRADERRTVSVYFFPTSVASTVAKAFAKQFPLTHLWLFVEASGAAYRPVLEGRCNLGILQPLPQAFPSLASERLGEVALVAVASPEHPLAKCHGRIPRHEVAKHVHWYSPIGQLSPKAETSASRLRRLGALSTCRQNMRF